jgi:glycosyltransferase involved in cell wall biosynthesis
MFLSIIIPTRNEAGIIASQIAYLQTLSCDAETQLEIIVCDGHSEDATAEIPRTCGAKVCETAPNRGLQQNAGAQISSGGVLWFLHADARPHPKSIFNIEKAMRSKRASGGNFCLRFDRSSPAMRAFAFIARMQRARGIYYGDSGIWIRREVFDLLSGFRDWPLFEDYDLARRLEKFAKRHGMRTEYSRLPITVSSRRLKNRTGKVLLQWLALQLLFALGAPPEKLARYYFQKWQPFNAL